MRIWKFPDQVVRLAFVFAVAIGALLVARQAFVPESFGEIGHYRAEAIDIVRDQEVHFAGLEACAECHDDIAATKAASYHRGLSCEGCHAASAGHAADPGEATPVIPTGRKPCLRCHEYLPSRPTGFPQIVETLHNPMEACMECHDAHDPTPPEVPETCAACHPSIARTKAVSHHWALDCETCHTARPEHRESPRAFLPSKPSAREFCAQCHAGGKRASAAIPQVDLASHGGRYLCWQCHYPHYPEGR